MKKNYSKKTFLVIILILLAFIGYYIGYNMGGILSFLPETYFEISPFAVIGIACLSHMFSVIIHEISHAIAFILQGVKVRTIIIGPFAFINKGKWTSKYNYNKILKTGGMVVPVIPIINNEDDFLSLKNKYSRAILVAPLISLSIGFLSIIYVILILINKLTISSYLFVFLLWMFLINLIINLSSLIKTSSVYGDYPAANQMKNNYFFAAQQIYSYMYFMENSIECRKKSVWLVNYISKELETLIQHKDCKLNETIYLEAVNTIIMEDLIGFRKNILIEDLCNYYTYNISTLTEHEKSETHKVLFIHILYWLTTKNDCYIRKYVDLCNNLFESKEIQNYYNKQIDLIINGNKNNKDLLNTRNIKSTALYSLYRIFEGFYFDELQLNQKYLSNGQETI